MPFTIPFPGGKLLYLALGACSLLLPVYTWKRLFRQLQRMREEKLFRERHNCCVTYFNGKGFAGWPPDKSRSGFNLANNEQIYEPLLYFLRTTKFKIDIATMILTANVIVEQLCEIAKRGVLVRLLMDYDRAENGIVQKLMRAGVCVKMLVSGDADAMSLMHHKYAVKDYNSENGFLVFGSLNWTLSAFTSNYEDIVFTSNVQAVKSFSDNFENMWSYAEYMEKHDVTTRAVLINKVPII